ncbi:MAG: hypothetical protein B7Z02_05750 [Rhodobacterales bacterium 32-67-9]|nr:MAG: hypothetical protein B7Z02_05750 [Rhodobacterales bacterium 32-67-9]
MKLNQIVDMIVRTVMRRVINLGINKGIDYASRRGQQKPGAGGGDHSQSRDARALAKRARQAAKITRRLGR